MSFKHSIKIGWYKKARRDNYARFYTGKEQTDLFLNAVKTNIPTVKLLVEEGYIIPSGALIHAIARKPCLDKTIMLEYLVDTLGVDVNQNVLFYAKNIEDINFLVKRGVYINHQDIKGETFLMKCLKNCNYRLVYHLIKLGANANIKDNIGNIALHYAFKHCSRNNKIIFNNFAVIENNFAVIKNIIDITTDPNTPNNNGEIPFTMLIHGDSLHFNFINILNISVEKGLNIHSTTRFKKNILYTIIILTRYQHSYGNNKSYDILNRALELGVDPYITDTFGKRMIDYCENNEIQRYIESHYCVFQIKEPDIE